MKFSKLISLTRTTFDWLWSLVKTFKLTAVVVVVMTLAFIGVSVLIGMPPFGFVVIIGLVAAPTVWYIVRAQRTSTSTVSKLTNARLLTVVFAATLGTMVAIQAIPYGRAHSNPPITGEPEWATPRTRELMVRACFGCHSNEVEYPAYASVAPISWVVEAHVAEGREKVNYSEFDSRQRGADETIEVIEEGSMPPGYYTQFGRHPEAKLTTAEVAELIAGLKATPGLSER
jgi:mono/diheme cytochrome c family protein